MGLLCGLSLRVYDDMSHRASILKGPKVLVHLIFLTTKNYLEEYQGSLQV